MLYAIGEIILVVIGILIALQINNWNERKKIDKSITDHMLILKQNLIEDREQLKILQASMEDHNNFADSLMLQLKTIIPVDKNTTKYLGMLMLEHRFKPNRNAIETISQSNELPFIKPELQKALLDYYALIESTNEREAISNNQIQGKYEDYINTNYPEVFQKNSEWPFIKSYYQNDPRTITPFNEKEFLSDKSLEAVAISRYFQSSALLKFYSDLIVSCDAIIESLDHEISKDVQLEH
jgi:hypothetical protein